MSNLLISAEIVLPLFVMMAVGCFCKAIRLVDDASIKVMNGLIFRVFLPALVCKNVMESSLDQALDPRVFLLVLLGVLAQFCLLSVTIPKLEPDHRKRGVMIQAMFRTNYACFGIPLVAAIYPDRDTSLAALLVVILVPLFNILGIVALEGNRAARINMKDVLKHIALNPLLIGSAVGLAFLLLGVRLPKLLMTPLNDLTKITTPLALFLLGAGIDFKKTVAHARQLTFCVVGKLVVFPAIFLAIAALLGLRDVPLACMLAAFGSPSAINSAIMAQQMGGDGDLATEAVVFTTAFSVPSMFLFIFVLRTLGLFS